MHIGIDHISIFHLAYRSSHVIINDRFDRFKIDFLPSIIWMNAIIGQIFIGFIRIAESSNCICYWDRIVFTNALDGSHFLCILTLRGFQNRDDRTIRVLTSDGSDDGFIIHGETICIIILSITDNSQIIIHIIVQGHRPDITGIGSIAAH